MKEALVIGGSNGIGLSLTLELLNQGCCVHVVDREENSLLGSYGNVSFQRVNLLDDDYSWLSSYNHIDTLIVTAGFGRICGFDDLLESEIQNSFLVNSMSPVKVLHHFFPRMKQKETFRCAVMGSIAGMLSSPLIALYGATKAALCSVTESLNIELEMAGTGNRILNVSPGFIKGTRFYGGQNDVSATKALACDIIRHMVAGDMLFIPHYDDVYHDVLERYHHDPHRFGVESYQYKLSGGRLSKTPQLKIGYLSGTFDLFHIGHLNLLRRAKQYCDYLVVGVHRDASHKGKEAFIPFDERVEIVKGVRYVDQVIQAEKEDSDVYVKDIVHYDYLFVGSDYKGTERFNRYEAYFADKGVKIVYFPYTKETSSTQLREALRK